MSLISRPRRPLTRTQHRAASAALVRSLKSCPGDEQLRRVTQRRIRNGGRAGMRRVISTPSAQGGP